MVTRGGSVTAQRLKNARWTSKEDGILGKCVEENGAGDWNKIAKFTGLGRSGKSCRERWVHHLRPKIKKGPLDEYEKNLIIERKKQLGTQWSLIANDAELRGRTDNHVKNFWYTWDRRQQRAGPQGMGEKPVDAFQLQHQQHDHQQQQGRPQSQTPPYAPSATSLLNQKCDAAEKGNSVAGVSSVEKQGNLGVESKKMGTSGEGMQASGQEPREGMNSEVNDPESLQYPETNYTSNGSTSTMTAGNQDTNLPKFSPATGEMDSMFDVDYLAWLSNILNDDPREICVCQDLKVTCV